MMRIRTLVFAGIIYSAAAAQAAPLSLSNLKPAGTPVRTAAERDIRTNIVEIDGNRHLKLASGAGAIYVPVTDRFSKDSLEKSFCAAELDRREQAANVQPVPTDAGINDFIKPFKADIVRAISVKCALARQE